MELGLVFRAFRLTLEKIAKIAKIREKKKKQDEEEKRKRKETSKIKREIDLPENVAQTVAMNVENSTVMAPVSLYAITCVRIINPMASRLYVPDGIISVILRFYRFKSVR